MDPVLFGTTAPIGGQELLGGSCFTVTVSIPGAALGMTCTATPQTYPGAGIYWLAFVSAPDTVTVKVCSPIASFTTESIYDVAVTTGSGGGSSILTTKGDLLTRDSTEDVRLPVGANGTVLTADSAQAAGIKWAAGGGGTSPLTVENIAITADQLRTGNTAPILLKAATDPRAFVVPVQIIFINRPGVIPWTVATNDALVGYPANSLFYGAITPHWNQSEVWPLMFNTVGNGKVTEAQAAGQDLFLSTAADIGPAGDGTAVVILAYFEQIVAAA